MSSRTELVLEGSATNDERMRALSCSSPTGEPCHVETPDRDYLFGTERFKQVSAALKGIHSFSPTLSIQAFSQLARINVGLADFRAVTTAGPRPFIAFDNLAPSGFTGDFDGDGAPDDPLVITSLLLNVIARWEPWPGSTFYGVYTRTQSVGQQTRERFVGLAQGPLEELFLIKAVLFL